MTTTNEELRRLADAASHGPWKGDRYDGTVKYCVMSANDKVVIAGDNGDSESGPFGIITEADEKYILAAHPSRILELLDHIATLEQESAANLQRALVAEKEVKQLHISLAGAVQHGIEGWNRYESANKMCVNQQKDIQRLNSAASDLANSHIRRVAERNLLSFLKHSNLDESNLRSAFSCVGVLADTSTQEVG